METLQIKIPKGYEVDSFDEKTGEIRFRQKPKEVTERIRTIEDVLLDHNLTQQDLDEQFKQVPEHLKYQYIAELLCISLNEGWKADWSDDSQYKYYPWFYMGGSRGFRFNDYVIWRTLSAVGSRLCLKSSKLAKYAGEQFIDLYKKFMIKS